MHQYDMRFFVDAMLGNIAKKLRLLGYDSRYFSDIDDKDLISEAEKENRIIISKDKELVKRAQKIGIKSILVTKNKEIDQFCEISDHVNLKNSKIDGDNARCPKCNSLTVLVDKILIKEKIPHKVYEMNKKFWLCNTCGQVYWEGTHIKDLQKFVRKLNE